MITRIGCGGFDIDNDTLIEEDGVLKVKNGGGEGGGIFVVTMTSHEGDTQTGEESYWTADKTCLEIVEALEQGKNVYAVQVDGDLKWYYFLSDVYHEPGFGTDVFFSRTKFGHDDTTGVTSLDMLGFQMGWRSGGTDSVKYQQYYSELNS